MNSASMSPKLQTRDLVFLALLGAIMMALKWAMAALPNIEPVSLLLICITLVYGWRSLYAAAVYILAEGIFFGFGIWWVSYLYIWPALVALTMLLRPMRSYLVLAILSALFGFLFGALCAIPYAITGGFSAGVAYWVSGLPFDLLHMAGNAALGALICPLHRLFCKLMKKPCWKEISDEKQL